MRFSGKVQWMSVGASGGSEMRILLVDDDRLVRSALKRTLRRMAGVVVFDYATPEEALAACAEVCFEVGVFDLKMPRVDGVELATRVRSILPNIRIVFVSADLSGELAARARAIAPTAVLPKPWPQDDLFAAVRG